MGCFGVSLSVLFQCMKGQCKSTRGNLLMVRRTFPVTHLLFMRLTTAISFLNLIACERRRLAVMCRAFEDLKAYMLTDVNSP